MTATTCLRELGLVEEYRSDGGDVIANFFVRCLSVATRYDRAVGYFTSDGLSVAARGLSAFVSRDSRARLVASPHLTQQDIDAMTRGLRAREDLVERRLLDAIAEAPAPPDGLVFLSWLVAHRRLDVKVAVPTAGPGIYHEKVGIFEDEDGCRVAFGGSANETVGGLITNFEAIDVFFSWDGSSPRVERKAANFDRLWSGRTDKLDVMPLPEAVRHELIVIAERHGPRVVTARRPQATIRRVMPAPLGFEARDYQREAIQAWLGNGGRGILSMATGSGKTKTALAAASAVLAARPNQTGAAAIVVVVPYVHLVDQWAEECKGWGLVPIRCYESSADWLPIAQEAIDGAHLIKRPILLVTTNKSAVLPPFQRILDQLAGIETLLVGDEVHHLGAEHSQTILRPEFTWRLGLSATPQRWRDEEGTDLLESYFGGIAFEFSIGEAINAGTLTPYRYEPVLVDLDTDELVAYLDVMARIESAAAGEDPGRAERVRTLLEERSRILNAASGKLAALAAKISGRNPRHTLFYCANRQQVGAVSEVLRSEGLVPQPFTAEEDRGRRAEIIADFKSGRTPAIVAIRALDEGVDIPDTREAHLLASSGNPREFVQRRGRILRLAPDKSEARLVDYVTVPAGVGPFERGLVEREMRRVIEFGATSMEPDLARDAIWPILQAYDLIHLLGR